METILITGASRGIGFAHATRFAEQGRKVFAAARHLEACLDLQALAAKFPKTVTLLSYDAADPEAASALAAALSGVSLDLLFANAGIIGGREGLGSVKAAALHEAFAINSVAPLLLAQALAENVAASQRKIIAFQSSLMGSIADNGSGGYYAYRLSKVALNMAARGLAQDLRGRGVIVVTLHPGWVQTRMGGAGAPVTVEACVRGQQALFDALTRDHSGRFFNYDGRELPW